jgi:tRNA threonylcarbamoyladenosine biosynthesis protein TsaB
MLLLAADTSGKHGSIALARCGPGEGCETVEVVALAGGTFSAQLVPQIAALLGKHGFTKQDVGALAVVSGPGSFTGLRVGLAAIKALAEILVKPIAAVSLLEVVAAAGYSQGKVLSALDAGRGEVYAGAYEADGATARLVNQRLLTLAEFVRASKGSLVVTPDRNLAGAACEAGLQVKEVEVPQADTVARVGWQKIRRGETTSPEALDANYIRRSDAEMFSRTSS